MMKETFAFALILVALFGCASPGTAKDSSAKLVLVTLDGVRWQEIFGGIDLELIQTEDFSRHPEHLKQAYWREGREQRREQLFPFLWSTVAKQGVLIGDRLGDSYMEVSNPWWFSYPGYNEILTGSVDRTIDSNDKNWNENTSFLEVLNNMKPFKNRVMAFASWDVFPYILNTQRSELPVNAGFSVASNPATEKSRWLNEVSARSPALWDTVRLDYLTHGYAMEALKNEHPLVTYIAYGETDDFAHDGSYDRYVDAAHRTDLMLSQLWSYLQSDPFYRGKTTLMISTDHGRGNTPAGWQHHLSKAGSAKMGLLDRAPEGVPESDQIWFAAIGPGIPSKGLLPGHWQQSQIAATALSSLHIDAQQLMPQAAAAIQFNAP